MIKKINLNNKFFLVFSLFIFSTLFFSVPKITFAAPTDEFVTTWKTDNAGTSNSTSITIPTNGGGYNYDVDWNNDGTFEQTGITGNVTHDFGVAGTYTIRIRGAFPRIWFAYGGGLDQLKIININQWGTIAWSSMAYAFYHCTNLIISATDAPNLSNVTDMTLMFYNATLANPDVSNWNVSNVTNMSWMFGYATSANPNVSNWNVSKVTDMNYMFAYTAFASDVSNWNVSNVTNMSGMFTGATSANPNVSNWNVSKVTDMSSMFAGLNSANPDVSNWNVSNVTNMSGMFWGASSANPDVSNWNVSKVTDMSYMFINASTANPDVSNWNVSNVTNMSRMFDWAISANPNVSNWNVSKVTDMSYMFGASSSFNRSISSWDVSNVTDMSYMFAGAANFNQNISSWNVSKVTNMYYMFNGAYSFNQDISSWHVSNVTDMTDMFKNVTLSTLNYDLILHGWGLQVLKTGVPFSGGNSKYCRAQISRGNIISTYGWTITDGGLDCTGIDTTSFITTWKTDNAGSSNSTSITIPTTGTGYNYDVDWNNDGTFEQTGITGNVTHDFGVAGTYTIRIRGAFPRIYFNSNVDTIPNDNKKLISVDQWGNIAWSSMAYAFYWCWNLKILAIDTPNLSNVTDISHMFDNAHNVDLLTSYDLSSWDVSNVTDMSGMFNFNDTFNQDISNWDVSNVTNMSGMFFGASIFNQNISSWDVSNVTDMSYMFSYNYNFNQDISGWDVSHVTNMFHMFGWAHSFNQNIGSWNVINVVNMSDMFWGATSFNQNIGSWDVRNVVNMSDMFWNVTLSTVNYDALLAGWAARTLQLGVPFSGGNSKYCNSTTQRASIISTYGWTITDGGYDCTGVPPKTWSAQISVSGRSWLSIASSSNGVKLVATTSGYIYTSNDGGSNWTERSSAGYRQWNSVTSSSDGTKLAAVAYQDYIYTSNDSGVTWTQQTNSGIRGWTEIASSSDGTKLVTGVDGGYIFTSTDSGDTWTERTSAGSRYWKSIASSSDGTKLAAVSYYGSGSSGGYIYTSTDSGATWIEQTNSGSYYWWGITSSSDGTKLAAINSMYDYIYTSVDGGVIWTAQINSGQHYWKSIISSSDGTKLLATSGGNLTNDYIYTSNDSGENWVALMNAGSRQWSSFVISSINSNIIASAVNDYIYTYGIDTNLEVLSEPASTNNNTVTLNGFANTSHTARGFEYGLTNSYGETTIENGNFNVGSFLSSSITIIPNTIYHYRAFASDDNGTVYSEDYTFKSMPFTKSSSGEKSWSSIASSSDGTKLIAAEDTNTGGYIYTSTDSGDNWIQRSLAGNRRWESVVTSSDGTKLAAVASFEHGYGNINIQTSTDSGVTWTSQTSSGTRNWRSIASSFDGSKLAAVAVDDYIRTSIDSGVTWTERTSSGRRQWESITSSSYGTKLAALVNGGLIFTSSDSGATWTEQISPVKVGYIGNIASSNDGLKLVLAMGGGNIYTSIDGGITWIERTSAGLKGWESIASSSDGTKLIAGVLNGGEVYISLDSGVTWTEQLIDYGFGTPGGWKGVSSSTDGTKLAAAKWSGYIYTYNEPSISILTTENASSITSTRARLNGTVTNTGGENANTRGFEYGLDTNYGETTTENGTFGVGAYIADITSLICNTTYHYRSYAINSAGTGYGNDQTFTIGACTGTSNLTTELANNITANSATLNGTITVDGGETTERGFEYGITNTYGETSTENGTFGAESYIANISSLTCETTYYYRSYAINSGGTSYGNEETFTTGSCFVIEVSDGIATITTQEDFESGILDSTLNPTETSGDIFLNSLPARTEFVTKWGTPGSNDGEFNSLNDVAVDSLGNLYVVDTGNNRIQKFTSEGVFVSKWGINGTAEGEFNYPSTISIDSLDNIYIVDKNNNRIQKFSTEGVFISTFGWGVADGTDVFQICTASCLAGISGSGDGQFSGPIGIGIDSLNNIYVADSGNYRVQKFDSTGAFILNWGEQSTNYGYTLNDNLSIPSPWAWETMNPLTVPNMAAGSGVIDDKIYIAGGTSDWDDLSSLIVYDPTNDSWDETKLSMSQTRVTPVSVVVADKLYIVGGRDYDWEGLNTMEVYDPTIGVEAWTTKWNGTEDDLAPMTESRIGAVGGAYDGKIYVVGGAKESCANNSQVSMEVYDVLTNTWETKSSAPVNKLTGSTGQFIDGILYIAGGQFWCDKNFSNTIISYNPATDTWNTELAEMPGKRAGGASAVIDGKFYYIGGTVETEWNSQSDIYVYDPSTDTWETFASSLMEPNHRPMIQTVGDDLYVIGGKDYNGDSLSTNYKINKSNIGVLSELPKEITAITWTESLPANSTLELLYSTDGGITWASLGTTPGTYPITEATNNIDYRAIYNSTSSNNYVNGLSSLTLDYTFDGSPYQYQDDDIGTFRVYPIPTGGEFVNILGLGVDGSGNVYVADESSDYGSFIHKFTSTGEFITNWGGPDSQYQRAFTPYDIAADSNGDIHVTDWKMGVIYKSNSEGDLIYHYGDDDTEGQARDGEFDGPTGIAIDSSNNIYVVDSGNNRIQKFESQESSRQPLGIFISSVLKASTNAHWSTLTSNETLSTDTSVTYQTRTGPNSNPDINWSAWEDVTTGVITSPDNQYFQVKATLSTSTIDSPILHSITINFEELVGIIVPTLTTQTASSINKTTAKLNGTITNTGGEDITVRGFEYGPTTSYGTTTTENGSFTTGAYTSNIESLTCDTTYHARSYATNSAGTSYGSDIIFNTSDCSHSSGGSVIGTAANTKSSEDVVIDICPNIIGAQNIIPSDLVIDGAHNCVVPQETKPINNIQKEPKPINNITEEPTPEDNKTPEQEVTPLPEEKLIPPEEIIIDDTQTQKDDLNKETEKIIKQKCTGLGCFINSVLGTTIFGDILINIEGKTFDLFNSMYGNLYKKVVDVFNSPVGKVITTTIATGGAVTGLYYSVVSTAFGGPIAASEILLTPLRLWTLLLAALGFKKRKSPWGTVYDSTTKQPIDPAYVVLQDMNGNEIATAITDLDGRYGFLVPPGRYRIIANKTNYEFPSRKLAGQTKDALYDELYFNEIIEITQEGQVITKNIPMDSIKFDWNEFAKKDQNLLKFFSRRELWIARISDMLFTTGFTISFIATLVSPVFFNILILCLYILMYILKRTILKPRAFGHVKQKDTDAPLPFAILRFFYPNSDHEVNHKVTDMTGKYYCLIANGNYITKIENKNPDESYTPVYTSESIEVENGYINRKFEV